MIINRILYAKGRAKFDYLYITPEGGKIIYDAYCRLLGGKYTMEQLELQGCLCDMTIVYLLQDGFLPKGFLLSKAICSSQKDACDKYLTQMCDIRKNNPYLGGSKKTVSDSELAILARSMIKRMKSSQKDIAVNIGVTTPTLSRMLNCQTPIKKHYSKIQMLFNTWRANKINSLRSEIARLKKFRT